jgi:hypothetical protein
MSADCASGDQGVRARDVRDLDTQHREASPTPNALSPDARRWIVRAMEIQYGADARVTEFARALWRESVAAARRGTAA